MGTLFRQIGWCKTIPVPQRSKTINKLVYITTFLPLHVFPLVLLKLSACKNLSTVIQYHHATTTWFCKMLTWIWKLILTNLYLKLFFVPFTLIGPFRVVCSLPWHLNRSEAGGNLVLLQTFLLFMCKSWYSYANNPVNMIIYIWKTRRFVARQGHCQPCFYQRRERWAHNRKMVYWLQCSPVTFNCEMNKPLLSLVILKEIETTWLEYIKGKISNF